MNKLNTKQKNTRAISLSSNPLKIRYTYVGYLFCRANSEDFQIQYYNSINSVYTKHDMVNV